MPSAIEVTGLTKRFSSSVLAVDDLSFSVAPGQVCGLLGPNGAGKTTTLRMMLGLIHPDTGTAGLLGEPAGPGSEVLHRVGALVEQPAFIPHLSGMKNLELYWRAGGGKWPAPGLEEGLALAGLGDATKRKVKTYSQGMRQRLGLAQTFLGEPELLILDEPTNGLDPGEMREIRRVVKALSDRGTTVLLSSHILAEVEQICSHAVVMDRGRLVAAGSVEELVGASGEVFLEVDDRGAAIELLMSLDIVEVVKPDGEGLAVTLSGGRRSDLVDALVGKGLKVETVTQRNRLEDAFLGLVGGNGG